MSLVLNGSGTIAGLTSGGLPDATITQAEIGTNVAGTGPAFLARVTSNQSVSAAVATKVNFDQEVFDTNSNYNPATYRFTPTVAGYYQINGMVCWSGAGTTQGSIYIYLNGAVYARNYTAGSGFGYYNSISMVVPFNGTTDYVEIYAQNSSAETLVSGTYTQFSGSLVRAA